jgi:hypothetical protein
MLLRIALHGVLVATLTTLITGCSTYRIDRQAARAREIPDASVEGLWEGRWYEAGKPSHGGRMRGVLTRTGDTIYRFASRSQWWGIFSASYNNLVVLTPVAPGEFLLHGDRDIWPFGLYSVTGRVDNVRLNARFNIADEEGVIEMHRPGVAENP